MALFSSKGYAIGEDYAQWLAYKLKTSESNATELIGHVEDLLAICGGRDYVFFLDAAVVERFSQLESLYGYLLEQADLGAEAGGKLRKAIITGFESVFCMSAVRSMAIISDAWLWPMLRAIEPGDDVHILDVCPVRATYHASHTYHTHHTYHTSHTYHTYHTCHPPPALSLPHPHPDPRCSGHAATSGSRKQQQIRRQRSTARCRSAAALRQRACA